MSTTTSHNYSPSKRKPRISDNAIGTLLMIGTFGIITLMFTSLYWRGY